MQTVTAQKHEWSQPLRKPLTFKLHVTSREQVFDLRSVTMAFNAAIPADVDFNPDPSGPVITAAQAKLGRSTSFKATFDPGNSALVTTTSMPADPTVTFNTDSPDASFGRPDLFNADLAAGALSTSYPIDVPAGPGGLTPPVQLAYNTAGLNEQHNPQGAAPWVGEGWSLNMGSISWAEHNVAAGCRRMLTCSSDNFEDSWQLNDPFGTSAELIPPDYRV